MTDLPHLFDISITFMLWTNGMLLYFCPPIQASKEHLEKHYADLSSKPFFPGLVEYMSSGPVVPMVGIVWLYSRLCKRCLQSPHIFSGFPASGKESGERQGLGEPNFVIYFCKTLYCGYKILPFFTEIFMRYLSDLCPRNVREFKWNWPLGTLYFASQTVSKWYTAKPKFGSFNARHVSCHRLKLCFSEVTFDHVLSIVHAFVSDEINCFKFIGYMCYWLNFDCQYDTNTQYSAKTQWIIFYKKWYVP